MNCPKCQSTEIDSGGFCLVCGLRAFVPEEFPQTEQASRLHSVTPEVDATASQAELPEWRLELSRRLQEIKLKRENGEVHPEAARAPTPSETSGMSQPPAGGSGADFPRPPSYRRPRRAPRMVDPDIPQAAPPVPKPEEFPSPPGIPGDPELKIAQELPSVQPAGDIVIRPPAENADAAREQSTQELIDSVMAKRAAGEHFSAQASGPEPLPAPAPVAEAGTNRDLGQVRIPGITLEVKSDRPSAPAVTSKVKETPDRPPAPVPESKPERKAGPKLVSKPLPMPEVAPMAEPRPVAVAERDIEVNPAPLDAPHDARLILLSRTLAGLVDLILVVLCAGIMVVAVDILEGIDVFDAVSMVYYGLLLLVMYFVYSIFFLGTAGQTIGMMLTDLRLTSASNTRPDIRRILVRCCAFLPCLGCAGLGLVWGCFDRQARCLHDLLSRTRVIRTPMD